MGARCDGACLSAQHLEGKAGKSRISQSRLPENPSQINLRTNTHKKKEVNKARDLPFT